MTDPEPRFVQIHTLHSYTATLLNRDDTGLAKRLPFGNCMRTRISSQCLKRHWRMHDGANSLNTLDGFEDAVRSREAVTKRVIAPLRTEHGFSEEVCAAINEPMQIAVYGKNAMDSAKRQPLLLGYPEIAHLSSKALEIARTCENDPETAKKAATEMCADKNYRENMKMLRETTALPGGLIGALFGRMVTSDPSANIEAPVYVAHAFTVHEEESESDYFTAVDDLQESDETGASHIGESEINSGIYYGYTVIDVPGLVSNLTGSPQGKWLESGTDRIFASNVVNKLLHLIATVSPGAKRGSTSPFSYAHLMLIEIGDSQPRTLANAYRTPCQPNFDSATSAMSEHLEKIDRAYSTLEKRRLMHVDGTETDGKFANTNRGSLGEIANWAAKRIQA